MHPTQQQIVNIVTARGESIITHINMCLMLIREFGNTDMDNYIAAYMDYLSAEHTAYFTDSVLRMHRDGYYSIS